MNDIIYEDMQEIYKMGGDFKWLRNKTILITGAYGMLASYLVYFFCFLDEEVLNGSVLIYAQGRRIEKLTERYSDYIDKPFFPCNG